MKDEVSDRAYAAGWALVKRMPERMARATFNGLAEQVWLQHGAGVRQLERNLRRVVGPLVSRQDLRRLSHRGMESYFRYWREAFRLPNLSPEQIVSTIEVDGQEHFRAAIAAGRGMVMALPHSGNWDHAGAWFTIDYPVTLTTVAERLKPESLYERFLDYRRKPRHGGAAARRPDGAADAASSARRGRHGVPAGGPRPQRRRHTGGLLR